MNKEQGINQEIALLQGFLPAFTSQEQWSGGIITWDAECKLIPDYCKILGLRGAMHFKRTLLKLRYAQA
jgi:hypothetical protein